MLPCYVRPFPDAAGLSCHDPFYLHWKGDSSLFFVLDTYIALDFVLMASIM